MRIGIAAPQLGPDLGRAQELVRFAARVEDLGYHSIWVGDRLITPVEPHDPYPGGEQPYPATFTRSADPLLVWTVVAAATDRVRLNSSTLNGAYYNAVQLARALTTLDVLSEGRLDVGLGLGWMRDEYVAAGIPYAERGRRLDDLLDLLTAWWTTNPVEHHSPYLDLEPAIVDLRPVQPGGPPVYLGGTGEAALRRVGRRASGWLSVDRLPPGLRASLWDVARSSAEQAGRDPDQLQVLDRVNVQPGESVAHVSDRVRRSLDGGASEAFVDFGFGLTGLDRVLDAAAELMQRSN